MHLRQRRGRDGLLLDRVDQLGQGHAQLLLGDGSDGLNKDVPVVALTADGMAGDKQKYLAQGFDAYVSKPVDERELSTVVGQVLNSTPDRLQSVG